jgi:response regulator RpfG family c-di-GMP phosphodiesterase
MTPLTSVLIVDDEPTVRDLMARWVQSIGLEPRTAANAEEALASLTARHCDLAVIDIMMPGKNGLWLAGELRRDHPHTAVVLATAYSELLDGSPQPVADLLLKPFRRERFVLAVDRGREWRRQAIEELEWHARLSGEVRERVAVVCRTLQQVRATDGDEVEALLTIARDRTPQVAEHSERVVRYCLSIAHETAVLPNALRDLELGARFHDIGKIATPEALLTKPSPLTPGEVAVMRLHVEAGREILDGASALRHLCPIVGASHEWFDGHGYPQKLAGSDIPLASRIIAVADAYDAMTQDRAYRHKLDSAEAVSELLRCTPSQFDTKVVVGFLTILGRH